MTKDAKSIAIRNIRAGKFASFCGLDLAGGYYSIGLHPWDIRPDDWSKSLDYVERNAVFDSVKAIGECGLDKLCNTPWDLQDKVFTAQILIAERLRKPMILHCVKAFDELIAHKRRINPGQAWIIHGFRGKPQQAEQLIRQGFFLSLGEKFHPGSLQVTPLERLFFETDDSGTVTIEEVYRDAAHILQMDLDDLIVRIRKNAEAYLSIGTND